MIGKDRLRGYGLKGTFVKVPLPFSGKIRLRAGADVG